MNKMDSTEEQRRIRLILDGKTGEYAYFVNTYSERVLDFVSRLVDNGSDAEELAQDAFVKAFRSLRTFDGRFSFLTWVCCIAVRVSLSTEAARQAARGVRTADRQL